MFRLRALRRACWKHSFLFNPLAARPVQHGGDKARVHLCFEQDFFPPHGAAQAAGWSQERQVGGRRPAPSSDAAGCVSLGESFHPPHQYKHRCWCYQRLLLVCLFSVLSQWLGTPKHENTQSRVSQVQLYSPTDSNLPPFLTHKMPEVLQGNKGQF